MSMVATRFRLAASWRIAAELCASRPGWRIYELHPGGGQDDVLSLREGTSTEHVALNREGTMHVFGTGWTGDGSWDRCIAEDGTVGVVKDILASFPSSTHKAKPADRAAVVTYRTIATVLTQRLFDADEWDARSQALDSSGGSGVRTDLASVDPTLVSADPYHVWLLTVNGAIITVLHDGWAYTRGGERLDIVDRLSGGASYADLAALVTRRPTAARRPPGMPSS